MLYIVLIRLEFKLKIYLRKGKFLNIKGLFELIWTLSQTSYHKKCVYIMLSFIKNCVKILLRLDFKQKRYLRKSWFLDIKNTFCDLEWPLRSYYVIKKSVSRKKKAKIQ